MVGNTKNNGGTAGTECEVSIIIPNWNGGEVLSKCLDSILVHTRGVEFELILIDNGSSDESRRTIEAFAARNPRVTAIFNDENLFFAKACNQGYAISRGRYLLVANNDILLTDDAVSSLVDYADNHPDVGVVTALMIDENGGQQEFYRRLPTAPHLIAHYHRLGRAVDRLLLGRRLQNHYLYRDLDFDDVEQIEQPGASFSLIRQDLIADLGGLFDENYPLLFNDVDLARRVKAEGAISVVVPEIRVVHLGGVSSEKMDPKIYRQFQFDAIFSYFRKNHPMQYPLLCCAWPFRWWSSRIRG